MYGMLHPPRYLRAQNVTGALRIPRLGGRELDLSKWVTQPCLIVSGWLDGGPTPYPLELDGASVESSGRVLVRWIMPLPDDWKWTVPEKIPRSAR